MSSPDVPPLNPNQGPQQESLWEKIKNEAQVAYFGLRLVIVTSRMERAGTVMEHMDHKDALYEHAGQLALTGTSTVMERGVDAAGNLAMVTPGPRNREERNERIRIEKLGFAAQIKEARLSNTRKAYGGGKYGDKQGPIIGGTHSAHKSIFMKIDRARARRKLSKQNLSYSERLAAEADIATNRSLEIKPRRNREQRRKTRASELAAKRAKQAAEEPITSHLRESKRTRAIGRIQKNYKKAEQIRQQLDTLGRPQESYAARLRSQRTVTAAVPNIINTLTPVSRIVPAVPFMGTSKTQLRPTEIQDRVAEKTGKAAEGSARLINAKILDEYRAVLSGSAELSDEEKKLLLGHVTQKVLEDQADLVSADRNSAAWQEAAEALSASHTEYLTQGAKKTHEASLRPKGPANRRGAPKRPSRPLVEKGSVEQSQPSQNTDFSGRIAELMRGDELTPEGRQRQEDLARAEQDLYDFIRATPDVENAFPNVANVAELSKHVYTLSMLIEENYSSRLDSMSEIKRDELEPSDRAKIRLEEESEVYRDALGDNVPGKLKGLISKLRSAQRAAMYRP
jgi:hypothetical protein